MSFLSKIGKVARTVGKTIGNVGGVVKTIANSPVTRTITTAVGTAGRALLPLAVASAPELAPIASVANKFAKGLQDGSVLNKVATFAGNASKVGNTIDRLGQGLK